MKNVGSATGANYSQIDNKVEQILGRKGAAILPSPEAYKEFRWTRDYFEQEPEEGYFVWVKKQMDYPLATRITISSPGVTQNPRNLVVIEKDIEAEINSVCNVVQKNLHGSHKGYSKIIVKENSRLTTRHFHKWEKRDVVESSSEFFLGKGAKLFHIYKCLAVPQTLRIDNNTFLDSHSSANFEAAFSAKGGDIDTRDTIFLNGEKSSGVAKLRMIAEKDSRITAHSRIVANAAGKGHLDCMGLLLDENSSIDAVPELLNKNKDATLTHEASIGKISEEELNYLRSRGLTENEATNLIVTGFLGEEPIILKEYGSSEFYM